MRTKVYILMIFVVFTALFAVPAIAAESAQIREQRVKAAFLYNFVNFVDWPKAKLSDSNDSVIIGIVGNKDLVNAFEPIRNKHIGGKKIVVKHFEDLSSPREDKHNDNSRQIEAIESLKKCHIVMLYFLRSIPINDSAIIIKALNGSAVLTVGERTGFLESGGNINFLLEKGKVRFEINLSASEKNGLKIRSKLLKLAKRVIKKEK